MESGRKTSFINETAFGYNNGELQLNIEKYSIKSVIKHSGEITGYELSNGEK